MDPVTMTFDYIEIFNEFRDIGEVLTNDQIIELMKVAALNNLAQAILSAKKEDK